MRIPQAGVLPQTAHDESIKHTADRVLNRAVISLRRFMNRKIAIPFTSSYLMNNTHGPYLMSPSTGDYKLILFATLFILLFIKMRSSLLLLH